MSESISFMYSSYTLDFYGKLNPSYLLLNIILNLRKSEIKKTEKYYIIITTALQFLIRKSIILALKFCISSLLFHCMDYFSNHHKLYFLLEVILLSFNIVNPPIPESKFYRRLFIHNLYAPLSQRI